MKLRNKLKYIGYEFLKINVLRHYFCWARYLILKRNLKILESYSAAVGNETVRHNVDALCVKAAFGMGNRMSLLLYPISVVLRNSEAPKVLIVGPRTEDDIFWAKSLGMINTRGLDLFSYSGNIDLGDIHQTNYPDYYFDAVILGWVISYSNDPIKLIAECKRITKPNGYIGFGIESSPAQRTTGEYFPPRANYLNSAEDIAALVRSDIVFIHDPKMDAPTDNAVVFQIN